VKYCAVPGVMPAPANPTSIVAMPVVGRPNASESTLQPVKSSLCAMSENQCSIEYDSSSMADVGVQTRLPRIVTVAAAIGPSATIARRSAGSR
jgi:hypothetical protein